MCDRAMIRFAVTFQEWAASTARIRHELAQVGIHANADVRGFIIHLQHPDQHL